MKDKLKITCGHIIVSSNLSTNHKKDLIEFISHQATEHQLMSMLLDGEISNLDETSNIIIEDRFYSSNVYNYIKEIDAGELAYNLWYILKKGGPLWFTWRAVKSAFSEAERKCGVLRISSTRNTCISKAKIKMYTERMKLIKRINCAKDKNMDKCEKVKATSMQKIALKIRRLNDYTIKKDIKNIKKKGKLTKGPSKGKATLI